MSISSLGVRAHGDIEGVWTATARFCFAASPRERSDFEAVASRSPVTCLPSTVTCRPRPGQERIYGSTPYPPDKMILFHNESSHLSSWPLRQFFFCVRPVC